MIKNFEVPEAVSKCLDGNAELEALGKKYGITNETDPDVIIKKVLTYVALHYLEVHKMACDLNEMWKANKFYDVGSKGGAYAHKILGGASEEPQFAKTVKMFKAIKELADVLLVSGNNLRME